jgi:hypothetical protein
VGKKDTGKNIWPSKRKCLRMPQENCEEGVFKNALQGKRSVGKPRRRLLNDFKNKLMKIDYKSPEKDTDAWKFILKEASILHGPWSQWRERERARARQRKHNFR